MERRIYLDNASTTFVSSEVLEEMMPCFNVIYGNAGSLHSYGREAMAVVDKARDRVAKAIGAYILLVVAQNLMTGLFWALLTQMQTRASTLSQVKSNTTQCLMLVINLKKKALRLHICQ